MRDTKKSKKSEAAPGREREEASRVLIDRMLSAAGWDDDQIALGGPRSDAEKKKLKGKIPDYVLYPKDGRTPIAVVEAKKPDGDLKGALTQGIGYAQSLGCKVVFVSDGTVILSAWSPNGEPLIIDGSEVEDFLRPDQLHHFQDSNEWNRGDAFGSSGELLKLFSSARKLLNKKGIAKIAAFNEFANLIFVKILTELRDDGDEMYQGIPGSWDDFAGYRGDRLLAEYRKVLSALNEHYGAGFNRTEATPDILEGLVGLLEGKSFISTDADIKGAAYEYFLRDYTKSKDELNRYFTPRHIVNMMVRIINPKLGERVYDPFCGTGGMLIQSFRYMKKRLPAKGKKRRDQFDNLRRNMLHGQDISEAAHVAKMNMILVGDGHNNIDRKDSTEERRSNMDVVITNIPFSSSGEKEFIRVCLHAVAESGNGRAAIIVPERVVNERAYADFRHSILKEWNVLRVVSLPRDVFAEYTNAKTSVLFLSRKEKGEPIQKRIEVYQITQDGFKGKKSRVPDMENPNDIKKMLSGELSPASIEVREPDYLFGFVRVVRIVPRKDGVKTVALREVITPIECRVQITQEMECVEPGFVAKEHKIIVKERKRFSEVAPSGRNRLVIKKGDLVISKMHTQDGLIAYSDIDEDLHSTGTHLPFSVNKGVDKRYLFWAARKSLMAMKRDDTTQREGYNKEEILDCRIPLPAKEQQQKIGKKMDAARQRIRDADAALTKAREDFDFAEQEVLEFDVLFSDVGEIPKDE